MTPPHTTTGQRIHALDALKAVLMTMGILLHLTLAYTPGADWAFTDWTSQGRSLEMVLDAIHLFRLPTFFLLAGFFAALLWSQRGALAMVKNRTARLALPFVVSLYLLEPLLSFSRAWGRSIRSFAPDPMVTTLTHAMDHLSPEAGDGHLWFLGYLCRYTVMVVGLLLLFERLPFPRKAMAHAFKTLWRSSSLFFLVGFALNMAWFLYAGWDEFPIKGRDRLPYYFVWYVMGWTVYASRVNLMTFRRHAWTWTALGIMLVPLRHLLRLTSDALEARRLPEPGLLRSLVRTFAEVVQPLPEGTLWTFHAVTAIAALLLLMRGVTGLFLRYANTESPRWRYLSDASYWVYLIHLPLTMVIPTLLVGWPLSMWGKYVTGVVLVSLLCLGSYESLVRTTFIGRFLNGRRYPARAPRVGWAVTLGGTAFLLAGMMNYPSIEDRPQRWHRGLTPPVLLAKHDVDILQWPYTLPTGETTERCVGVDDHIICADPIDFDTWKASCQAMSSSPAVAPDADARRMVNSLVWSLLNERVWILDAPPEPDQILVPDDAGPWAALNMSSLRRSAGESPCVTTRLGRSSRLDAHLCADTLGYVCERP